MRGRSSPMRTPKRPWSGHESQCRPAEAAGRLAWARSLRSPRSFKRLACDVTPERSAVPSSTPTLSRPASRLAGARRQRLAARSVLLAIGLFGAAACSKAPELVPEVTVLHQAKLPADPLDAAWSGVPIHEEPLLLQDLVEPRLLKPSSSAVRVQAVTDGARVCFRIEWKDATNDDLPGDASFSDACAVQLPARIEADVPAPQMGEPNRPVQITYWRAFWQAVVDGRPDTIEAIYPGAAVGHYPFDAASLQPGSDAQREMAKRYAPARAVGNDMAGPRDRPVEDLEAEGPGTLRPAGKTLSAGRGRRTKDGWAVVMSRPMPDGLLPGGRTQVAFAVWEGGSQEVGSRKMRSAWVPMIVRSEK
jgi:DMSO reductase family type II enzyme heme b subunit